jgi:molecular chaperone Hsp33
MTSPKQDLIHRFIFDQADVRGEIVTLDNTLLSALEHQQLPLSAKALLGEFLVAVSLMKELFKVEGRLTLQVRGAGLVPLIVAEANEGRTIRGILKYNDQMGPCDIGHLTLPEIVGQGVLSITLDPLEGQRYQGIVGLEGTTLAQCLTHYFSHSEQLPTRVWLMSDGAKAGGLLLQALPPSHNANEHQDVWQTAEYLGDTVTQAELLNLDHAQLLHRLFNEFDVRLFPGQPVAFQCTCSRERSLQAIAALGEADALALLRERHRIDVNCEFCGAFYQFDQQDLLRFFKGTSPILH